MAQDHQGKFAGPIHEFMALNPAPPAGAALRQIAKAGSIQGWVDAVKPCETTPGKPEWHGFEIALARAATMADLQMIKAIYPKDLRREVMTDWDDDRYYWLADKAARLRRANRAIVAV